MSVSLQPKLHNIHFYDTLPNRNVHFLSNVHFQFKLKGRESKMHMIKQFSDGLSRVDQLKTNGATGKWSAIIV